jgi:hypothetical protein
LKLLKNILNNVNSGSEQKQFLSFADSTIFIEEKKS